MKKALTFLDENLEKIIITICMGYLVLVTVLQVLFRFVLKAPLAWTEETARYSFIWMTFVGASLASKNASHIRVDMLENALHGVPKQVIYWGCQLIFLSFTLTMTVVGIGMIQTLNAKPQVSPAMKMPMQYLYAALPVGMGLCSFRILQGAWRTVRANRAAKREGSDKIC